MQGPSKARVSINVGRIEWVRVIVSASVATACGVDDRQVSVSRGSGGDGVVDGVGGSDEVDDETDNVAGEGGTPGDPVGSNGGAEPCENGERNAGLGCGSVVAECEPNTARCNPSGQHETCSTQGAWSEAVACPFVCIDGNCVGECVPDGRDCLLGKTPRRCDPAGVWQVQEECPAVCVDGACVASCEIGTRQCSNLDLLQCGADGVFELERTCEILCDDSAQACGGECVPNSLQCLGSELQICGAEATWGLLTTCPFVCSALIESSAAFGCSGECVPYSTRCGSTTELATCNSSGSWDPPSTCSEQACGGSPATCQGECTPGVTACDQASTLLTCNAAGGFVPESCSERDQTCIDAAGSARCNGECAPGQQRCNGNRVQSCNASGGWTNAAGNCTTQNQTCVQTGDRASCSGVCAPGQTTCSNNDANGCSATGTLTLIDDCAPPDEICAGGACISNDPYSVGAASSAGFSTFAVPNETWYVVPVEVPETATLLALRLIGAAAGGQARLALWEDDGGVPGAFVTQTNNIAVGVGIGSATAVPAALVTGGTRYWVGAKFIGNATIFQGTGSTAYWFEQMFAANPITTMDPFPIGFAVEELGLALNFHLLVRDVSQ